MMFLNSGDELLSKRAGLWRRTIQTSGPAPVFLCQVWPRMEDGAGNYFKCPPPNIEFTLPSPKLGQESVTTIDPPWAPVVKASVEEVTVSQGKRI